MINKFLDIFSFLKLEMNNLLIEQLIILLKLIIENKIKLEINLN